MTGCSITGAVGNSVEDTGGSAPCWTVPAGAAGRGAGCGVTPYPIREVWQPASATQDSTAIPAGFSSFMTRLPPT